MRKVFLILVTLLLTACMPRSAPREVKIALVAPFEGEGRPLGYSVLSGAKLALQEADHKLPKGEIVSLVALNDDYEPDKAARQIHTAGADPAVLVIIGPWSRTTASAAAKALRPADPPMVIPAALPDDLVSSHRYRFFADDRSLAETAGKEARSVGGCGTILVGSTSPLLEGRGCPKGESPHWVMACCSPTKTLTALSDWRRQNPSARVPVLIAGPDAYRPWILSAMPDGVEIRWVTSWPSPDAGFSERFQKFAKQEATPASFAAYEATKQVLAAMSAASGSGDLSRDGVDRALSWTLAGKKWPAHVIVVKK